MYDLFVAGLIGTSAGQTSQNPYSIAIGTNAGNADQSANSIAIGTSAGQTRPVVCFFFTNQDI
jgi:hypothetical protein